jgi:hypothetical protein
MSVLAFHKKAGLCQLVFSAVETSSSPIRSECDSLHAELLLSPPFHPHSDVSVPWLGASWVFSIQPVLPPVIATFHSISQRECWARPMTQSPELGL